MSVRALLRSTGFQPLTLPTDSRPQHVSNQGFEYDPCDLLEAEEQAESAEEGLDQDVEVDEAEEADEADDQDGTENMIMEDDAELRDQTDEAEGEAEPLLGLAESLVLPFSLTQTRNHHLTSLFPHVFSHPPIPSHSKPRAKAPPKGTFIFPTPPTPTQPLPLPEYHGPIKASDRATAAAITIDDSGPSGSTPPPASSSTVKSTRPSKPRKSVGTDGETEPPAHEIECISRCTLSVGPISFPGTEVWIGRFVEPQLSRPKKERAKPGERKEKRKLMAEEAAARRARLKATSTPRPRASLPPKQKHPPAVRTPNTPVRPPPPRPPAPSAPSGSTPTAPRPTASPQLIQLVNQAASRHPWLSALIYKAAGSTANQEELERLGKAVARLSRGEPIDDLAPGHNGAGPSKPPIPVAGQSSQTKPPASAQVDRVAPSIEASTSTASSAPSAPTVTPSDFHESDGEPDMKGAPQEGGGPLPPPSASPTMESHIVKRSHPSTSPGPKASPEVAPLMTAPPSVNTRSPTLLSPRQTPAGLPQPQATTPHSDSPTLRSPPPHMLPPPPPRPTYPLPPPFVLIAFKEHPTEKFLLPLGLHSYISRIGGDWVTGAEPVLQPEPGSAKMASPAPVPALQQGLPTVASQDDDSKAKLDVPVPGVGEERLSATHPAVKVQQGRGRTRASIGRTVKEVPSAPAVSAPNSEADIVSPPDAEPIPEPAPPINSRPSSGLTPLPGMGPSPGTVLLSMFAPADKWERVDWETVVKHLPFGNPDFWDKPVTDAVKDENVKQESPESEVVPSDKSVIPPGTAVNFREKRSTRPAISASKINASAIPHPERSLTPNKPDLLNLAANDLMPSEGSVQALTIRLEGLDDGAWHRLKSVMELVEREEVNRMVKHDPDLLAPTKHDLERGTSPQHVAPLNAHAVSNQAIGTPSRNTLRSELSEGILATLRPTYQTRKKTYFANLLKRVTPRTFLRTRLPPPPLAELVEASTDKWAPRPYPISTEPLYTIDTDEPGGEGDEAAILDSPELKGKKRKADAEPAVTFEMPVSLEALDERVEEGAKRGLARRGRGRGRGGAVGSEEGRKKNKRGTEKGTCEGCAKEGIKVWRRGPGGRGTLCNACGDLFTVDRLPPLKAPGAMSAINGVEADGEDDEREAEAEVAAASEFDEAESELKQLRVEPAVDDTAVQEMEEEVKQTTARDVVQTSEQEEAGVPVTPDGRQSVSTIPAPTDPASAPEGPVAQGKFLEDIADVNNEDVEHSVKSDHLMEVDNES